MPKKTVEVIVRARLKRYRFEVIILWLTTAVGVILILTGMGVYFYVGKLTVAQYLSTISIHNVAVSQVQMLHDFSKVLGIVFALVGVVGIVFALDRLALIKNAYRMVLFIKGGIEKTK